MRYFNVLQMPGFKIIKVNLLILILMLLLTGCYRLQVGAQSGLAATYHPIGNGVEFGTVSDYYAALIDNDPTQEGSFLLSPHYKSHKDPMVEYKQVGADFGYQYIRGTGTSRFLIVTALQAGRATVEPKTYTAKGYKTDEQFVTKRQAVTTYGAYYMFHFMFSGWGWLGKVGYSRVPLEGEYTNESGTTTTTKPIEQTYLGTGLSYTF
jgi:hypothetical protein